MALTGLWREVGRPQAQTERSRFFGDVRVNANVCVLLLLHGIVLSIVCMWAMHIYIYIHSVRRVHVVLSCICFACAVVLFLWMVHNNIMHVCVHMVLQIQISTIDF